MGNQQTTIRITVAAGTHIGSGEMSLMLKQDIAVDATLHTAKGTPYTGDDWYGFDYRGWGVMVMADHVQVVTSEPPQAPKIDNRVDDVADVVRMSLAEAVADMTSTLVRIGEALGWDHQLVKIKEQQLDDFEKELASQREARRVAVQQPRLVG